MKNGVRQLLLAVALVIIAQGAWAQTKPWYVAAGLGASFVNDIDSTGSSGVTLTTDLDTGILGTGAFGRSFGNVRVEGELVYNANNILVKI